MHQTATLAALNPRGFFFKISGMDARLKSSEVAAWMHPF